MTDSNESSNGTDTPTNGTTEVRTDDRPMADKSVAGVFGEVVWLMSQSKFHKQVFLSDLEWLVMPAIMLRQFRLFYGKDRPIGVILYASVSEEVEKRLIEGKPRLKPEEWKSGDRLWVVEIVAPFGGATQMAEELANSDTFKGKSFRAHVTLRDGKRELKVFGQSPASSGGK